MHDGYGPCNTYIAFTKLVLQSRNCILDQIWSINRCALGIWHFTHSAISHVYAIALVCCYCSADVSPELCCCVWVSVQAFAYHFSKPKHAFEESHVHDEIAQVWLVWNNYLMSNSDISVNNQFVNESQPSLRSVMLVRWDERWASSEIHLQNSAANSAFVT